MSAPSAVLTSERCLAAIAPMHSSLPARQEARLCRQYRQDLKELQELQKQRQAEKEQINKRATHVTANGFEFTKSVSLNQNGQPTRDHQEADRPLCKRKLFPLAK